MEDRKHNYVVGYEGEGQCVYGRHESICRVLFLRCLYGKRHPNDTFSGSSDAEEDAV